MLGRQGTGRWEWHMESSLIVEAPLGGHVKLQTKNAVLLLKTQLSNPAEHASM